jgi:hypothetical protein
VNAGFRQIADADPLVYYIDAAASLQNDDGTVMTDIFNADNLHFNELGHTIWGASIRGALMPREARFEKIAVPAHQESRQ